MIFIRWHRFATEIVLQSIEINISQTDAKFALGQFTSDPFFGFDFCHYQHSQCNCKYREGCFSACQ